MLQGTFDEGSCWNSLQPHHPDIDKPVSHTYTHHLKHIFVFEPQIKLYHL
jgi:hypothetical protein